MSYFEYFGFKPYYDIDKKKLNKQYLLAQMELQARIEKGQKVKKANMSALDLNKAFKTLDDDYLRAMYLLDQQGIKITDQNSKEALSSDDLNEILLQLEVIEEMEQLSSLQNVKQIKEQEKLSLVAKIDKALRSEEQKEAVILTIKLKYLQRVLENLNAKIKQFVV